jgi:hypothetical protein
MSQPTYTLADLADRFALELRGDGTRRVSGVGTLAAANEDQVSFLANPVYRPLLRATRAAAVVLAQGAVDEAPGAALVSANPYADFARIAALFERAAPAAPGVHPSAVVEAGATVDPSASIGPCCTIAAGARIEAGAVLGPHCIVGPDCVVGPQSRLVARVTLVERVRLGARVIVHPGAVIGADGFGLAMDHGHWLKVPQLGGVVRRDRRAHGDGRLCRGRRERPDRPLLPDRRGRGDRRPHRDRRQGHRHGHVARHPRDPRGGGVFLGHADTGQSHLAPQRGAIQAPRCARPARLRGPKQ